MAISLFTTFNDSTVFVSLNILPYLFEEQDRKIDRFIDNQTEDICGAPLVQLLLQMSLKPYSVFNLVTPEDSPCNSQGQTCKANNFLEVLMSSIMIKKKKKFYLELYNEICNFLLIFLLSFLLRTTSLREKQLHFKYIFKSSNQSKKMCITVDSHKLTHTGVF